MKHILTISGACGAGKNTFLDGLLVFNHCFLLDDLNEMANSMRNGVCSNIVIRELVSHTTRKPKQGEVNGYKHYFVDPATFELIKKVEIAEYAGDWYCLAESELKRIKDGEWGAVIVGQYGLDCIRQFVAKHSDEYDLVSVFLTIDENMSEQRMVKRNEEDDSVKRRLAHQATFKEYYPRDPDKYDLIMPSYDDDDYVRNIFAVQYIMEKRSNLIKEFAC